MEYLRDPAEIYRRSFATIAAEADFTAMPSDVAEMATRLIHACGMVDLVEDLVWTPDVVSAGREALAAGATILTDAQMVASGIMAARLPVSNRVLCTLSDPGVPGLAAHHETTRSAAAPDASTMLWLRVSDEVTESRALTLAFILTAWPQMAPLSRAELILRFVLMRRSVSEMLSFRVASERIADSVDALK